METKLFGLEVRMKFKMMNITSFTKVSQKIMMNL